MQAAFVATAYTWTISPGIKVSGAWSRTPFSSTTVYI